MSRKWISFSFECNDQNKKTHSRAPPIGVSDNFVDHLVNDPPSNLRRDVNILEKLHPRTVDELAVHKKKIKDVEKWLRDKVLCGDVGENDANPVLLLSGPTGCGKTAVINVLCKRLEIGVTEWITPCNQQELKVSQVETETFLDFFSHSKYSSLFDNSLNKYVTLVEDFPNCVTRNPALLRHALELSQQGRTPVVFICTNTSTEALDLVQTLFPNDLRKEFNITAIPFNPCSETQLRFALKRAENIIRSNSKLTFPSALVFEAIIATSMGDIRCALNQLQFSCLRESCNQGLQQFQQQMVIKKRGSKRTVKYGDVDDRNIRQMSRDAHLGLFHGLGRVLNPKRVDLPVGGWRISCDLQGLINEFDTQPSIFVAFLHRNYFKYFGDARDVFNAAILLSDAQSILDKWTDQHGVSDYGLWMAVLALMVHNNHHVSKWTQIKAPTKISEMKVTLPHSVNKLDNIYRNKILKNSKHSTFLV